MNKKLRRFDVVLLKIMGSLHRTQNRDREINRQEIDDVMQRQDEVERRLEALEIEANLPSRRAEDEPFDSDRNPTGENH